MWCGGSVFKKPRVITSFYLYDDIGESPRSTAKPLSSLGHFQRIASEGKRFIRRESDLSPSAIEIR